MALFKILKGNKSGLDSLGITNGYCYVTLDEQKMYIDHINESTGVSSRFCLNADHADTADTANKLDCGTIGGATIPVYFASGVPQTCTSLSLDTSGNAATATVAASCSGNAATATVAASCSGNAATATTAASCSGNAATATKLATARTITLTGDVAGSGNFDGSGNLSITTTVADNSHSHSYLPLAGGAMIGQIKSSYSTGGMWISGRDNATVRNTVSTSASSFAPIVSSKTQLGSWELGPCHPQEDFYFSYATDANYNASTNTTVTTVCIKNNGVLMGAAWNDYAEYRTQKETIEPGYCVASADNGQVYKTTEKFQACDGIVSDTFGFAIGETDECKTPLAVAGRVLAYFHGNREDYHSGDTVCAGPEGKVIKMTREEIKEYPDRIVGIVSEIPEYETWGSGDVPVNGRIWIKVR